MNWQLKTRKIRLDKRALIMGILNATPDSSTDGGLYSSSDSALEHAREMIAEGADIIDIGGESTRPGARSVGIEAEKERVIPVIQKLREEWDGLISIDTMTPDVARVALAAGADIVNDVSGLRLPEMRKVCAAAACGVVIMHMQGEPRTMQKHPHYENVVNDIRQYFSEQLKLATQSGIRTESIVFDPGIGFGKNLEHNFSLLRDLPKLSVAGRPLLMGLSRKSFIGRALGDTDMGRRSSATVALSALMRMNGAMIHRVHEVQSNHDAIRLAEEIMYGAKD